MIYFLHGTDTKNSRKKMHEILGQLSAKRPNSEVFKMTSENWQSEQFDELLGAQGLFEKKYIVVLDFVLSLKETREFVLEKVAEMQNAEHWFLILDGKTDAATVKKLEKFSYKSEEFSKPESRKEQPIIFTIEGGLLARNKKQLWICFVDLLGHGIAAEEIHGVLFWAVKNMIIAARVESGKDSGLAPYSYSKSLSGGRNYKLAELKKMSGDLVEMTHKVRNGNGEMEVMLEKWILEI
jgi:uncharacterized membrane protein